MAAAKRILPAILLANDLLDGDVLVRSATGWSRDPADARVARTDDEADALEAEAKQSMAARAVVDAYLVDVTVQDSGFAVPNHFRERFRILGPTHRPDLGKQAEFAVQGSNQGQSQGQNNA